MTARLTAEPMPHLDPIIRIFVFRLGGWLMFFVPGVVMIILAGQTLWQLRRRRQSDIVDASVIDAGVSAPPPAAPIVPGAAITSADGRIASLGVPATTLSYAVPARDARSRSGLWLRVPMLLLLSYPIVFAFTCASLVVATALKLGHWPRPSLDDPAFAAPRALYRAVGYGLYGWVPAQLAMVTLYCLLRPPRPYPWLAVAAGACSLVIYGQEPVIGFWYWLFD